VGVDRPHTAVQAVDVDRRWPVVAAPALDAAVLDDGATRPVRGKCGHTAQTRNIGRTGPGAPALDASRRSDRATGVEVAGNRKNPPTPGMGGGGEAVVV